MLSQLTLPKHLISSPEKALFKLLVNRTKMMKPIILEGP